MNQLGYSPQSVIALALWPVLSLTSVAAGVEPATNTTAGTERVDLLRILIVDRSSSMKQIDSVGLSRLEIARRELTQSLVAFPPTPAAPVVLVPFAERVQDVVSYTSMAAAVAALSALRPAGQTDIAGAIDRTVEEAQRFPPASHLLIYLYSDGEQTIGGADRVQAAEARLDELFGARAERGLSQSVIVKRWGGVNASLVAHLSRNPHVQVHDVGQLVCRSATIVPAVELVAARWSAERQGVAQLDLALTLTVPTSPTLPAATLPVNCPLPDSRWIAGGDVSIAPSAGRNVSTLETVVDEAELCRKGYVSIPLQIKPSHLLRAAEGVALLFVVPHELAVDVAAGQLPIALATTADLVPRADAQWVDVDRRLAAFPVTLRLQGRDPLPAGIAPELSWSVEGAGQTRLSPTTLLQQASSCEFPLTLQHAIPMETIRSIANPAAASFGIPTGPAASLVPVQLQVRAELQGRPPCFEVSPRVLELRVSAPPPQPLRTRLTPRWIAASPMVWEDPRQRLAAVEITLELAVAGHLPSGTTLNLIPSAGVRLVSGTPVTVRSGTQRFTLQLLGEVPRQVAAVQWSLQIEPLPASAVVMERPAALDLNIPRPTPAALSLTVASPVAPRSDMSKLNDTHALTLQAQVGLLSSSLSAAAQRRLRVRSRTAWPVEAMGTGDVVHLGESLYFRLSVDRRNGTFFAWRDVAVPCTVRAEPIGVDHDIVSPAEQTFLLIIEAPWKRALLLAAGVAAVAIVLRVLAGLWNLGEANHQMPSGVDGPGANASEWTDSAAMNGRDPTHART
ncbi:MAG: VWA domain-containing protein [Planctomycetes bacterium]|nr:VWA domain-containing protein [Planctomycetota bacterium]